MHVCVLVCLRVRQDPVQTEFFGRKTCRKKRSARISWNKMTSRGAVELTKGVRPNPKSQIQHYEREEVKKKMLLPFELVVQILCLILRLSMKLN